MPRTIFLLYGGTLTGHEVQLIQSRHGPEKVGWDLKVLAPATPSELLLLRDRYLPVNTFIKHDRKLPFSPPPGIEINTFEYDLREKGTITPYRHRVHRSTLPAA